MMVMDLFAVRQVQHRRDDVAEVTDFKLVFTTTVAS